MSMKKVSSYFNYGDYEKYKFFGFIDICG